MTATGVPAISVVIPTADRAALVMRAVGSVLSAARSDLPSGPAADGADVEVIVVDDASTDDTVARLKALGESRLRVIDLPRRSGANIARNTGAAASRAPLLAFLDSDDTFAPGRPGRLVALFETRPDIDAAMDDFEVVTGDRTERAEQPKGVWRGDRLTRLLVAHAVHLTNSALTVRRTVFDAVGGFDVAFHRQQDRDLLLRIARNHAVALGTGGDVTKHQIVRSMSRRHDGYVAALDRLVGSHPVFLAPEFNDLLGYLTVRGMVKALSQGDVAAAWRERQALRRAHNLPMGTFAALMRYAAGRGFRRAIRRTAMAGDDG